MKTLGFLGGFANPSVFQDYCKSIELSQDFLSLGIHKGLFKNPMVFYKTLQKL